MEDLKATLTKYWWVVLGVIVLYMTGGTKTKRRRTKARYMRARRGMRTMRRRMRR